MALQLLGSKYCIESLRKDVTDLQEAITDVSSRSGPVRTPSWKYPDKVSSDIDITELLEIYDYTEDEEDRQIAHIVLLELVIDRLALLLQSLTKYTDQSLSGSGGRARSSPQSGASDNHSIGLIIKKYWSKMVNLQHLLQTITSESKNNKRKITDLENNMQKVMQEREQLLTTTETLNETLRSAKTPFPLNNSELDRLSETASVLSISRDECNKSTQTIETAFVPCESCNSVQKCFRDTGNALVSMCQSQGLPSSLSKVKSQLSSLDWLTGNDVMRWSAEQNKDIERLNKHLSQFNALQTAMEAEKGKSNKLSQKNVDYDKEIKLEREAKNLQQKHYESKIKGIEKERESIKQEMNVKTDNLSESKCKLEAQLQQMKGELDKQQQLLHDLDLLENGNVNQLEEQQQPDLNEPDGMGDSDIEEESIIPKKKRRQESAKQSLEINLSHEKDKSSQIKGLEGNMDGLQSQLHSVTDQYNNSQQDLLKEQAKCKSISRHAESIQTKQAALLKRIEDLDQTNEKLESELEELELEKENVEKELDIAQNSKKQLEDSLQAQKHLAEEILFEKEALEKSYVQLQGEIKQLEVTLEEVKERERLMIEYPDLNGPVNPDMTGTGDIVQDMENQAKANAIRIHILEEQNTRLRNSITKILQSQNMPESRQQYSKEKNVNPVPLWKRNSSPVGDPNEPERNSTTHKYNKGGGLKALERTAEATKVRHSFVIGRVTPSSEDSAIQSKKTSNKSLMCSRCEKMYSFKKDLDIHKTYCQK